MNNLRRSNKSNKPGTTKRHSCIFSTVPSPMLQSEFSAALHRSAHQVKLHQYCCRIISIHFIITQCHHCCVRHGALAPRPRLAITVAPCGLAPPPPRPTPRRRPPPTRSPGARGSGIHATPDTDSALAIPLLAPTTPADAPPAPLTPPHAVDWPGRLPFRPASIWACCFRNKPTRASNSSASRKPLSFMSVAALSKADRLSVLASMRQLYRQISRDDRASRACMED